MIEKNSVLKVSFFLIKLSIALVPNINAGRYKIDISKVNFDRCDQNPPKPSDQMVCKNNVIRFVQLDSVIAVPPYSVK